MAPIAVLDVIIRNFKRLNYLNCPYVVVVSSNFGLASSAKCVGVSERKISEGSKFVVR